MFQYLRFAVIAILLSPMLLSAAEAPGEEPAPRILVLTGVNLIDGSADEVVPGATIVVKGSEIVEILTEAPGDLAEDAFVLHLPGHWVIPGLIDAHVHVSHDTRADTEKALEIALLGGVTGVRDMGGDARRLASLKRDALLGEIPSPDIYYSAVFAGPSFFDDPRVVDVTRGVVPGEAPWARAVRPDADLIEAAIEARGAGATALKIYANLPPKELARTTAAGHAAGLEVWSHASVFPCRPSDAIEAGVDVISHADMLYWQTTDEVPPAYGPHRSFDPPGVDAAGSPVFDELFASMVAEGTILDPTLYVDHHYAENADEEMLPFWKAYQLFSYEVVGRAHATGVKIAAGTDFLVHEGADLPNIHAEMRLLVEAAGFTTMEAIKAATTVGAEVLGAEDRIGTIEVGKRADMVILAADPTDDISNTVHIRFVVKSGELIVRH